MCPRPTRSAVILLLIISEPASRGLFTALWMQGWGGLPCPGRAGSAGQDGAHHQQLVFQHHCFKPQPAWEPPHCGHSCRRAVSHSTWPRARRAARSQHRHVPVGAREALSPLCVCCQFLRDGSWAFLKQTLCTSHPLPRFTTLPCFSPFVNSFTKRAHQRPRAEQGRASSHALQTTSRFKGDNKKHHTHAQPRLNLALSPLHIITGLRVPRGGTQSPLNLSMRAHRARRFPPRCCGQTPCLPRAASPCPGSARLQGRAWCLTLPCLGVRVQTSASTAGNGSVFPAAPGCPLPAPLPPGPGVETEDGGLRVRGCPRWGV